MNQTWENSEKPNFQSNFASFGQNVGPPKFFVDLPLLVARHCSKLSSYAVLKKTNKPNLRKWQKA